MCDNTELRDAIHEAIEGGTTVDDITAFAEEAKEKILRAELIPKAVKAATTVLLKGQGGTVDEKTVCRFIMHFLDVSNTAHWDGWTELRNQVRDAGRELDSTFH